ncbi:MAG TPA: C40 family peptidase [Methylomirabilota bacterium]|jgi:cell wall-associated NlpC family hydrolase
MTPATRGTVTGICLAVLVAGAGCAKAVLAPEDYGVVVPPPPPPIAEGEPASRNAAAARLAAQYLGTPYEWAGASPGGFDCSGLVSYVYGRVGVAIPHNAAQQYRYGTPVAREDLEPGDVVFFNRLRHNGIYLGDGRFIHAASPGGVKIGRLDNDWFRTRWVGARRL